MLSHCESSFRSSDLTSTPQNNMAKKCLYPDCGNEYESTNEGSKYCKYHSKKRGLEYEIKMLKEQIEFKEWKLAHLEDIDEEA